MMSVLDLDSIVSGSAARGPQEAAAGLPAEPPEAVVLPGRIFDGVKILSRGIRRRRSVPLMGYVGLNGHGKSFSMVRDTLPTLAMGRRVLSTVQLLDPHTGNRHPLCVPFMRWSQLEDVSDCDMLLDEVTGIMDARDSGMPKRVRRLLPQMRHRGVRVRWTGVDWDNSDKRLRQITQAVTKCYGFIPNVRLAREADRADSIALWTPNRAFMLTTYDASTLTVAEDGQQLTQDEHKRRRARVKCRELVWGPRSIAFQCYRTLDAVEAIDSSCPIDGYKVIERTCRHTEEERAAAFASMSAPAWV